MQVKNTFLEFVPEPPTDLRRWATTPAGKTADTREEPDDSVCSREDNADLDRRHSYPEHRSAKISLHHLKTGDFLDLEDDAFHSPREPVAPAVPSASSCDNVGGSADHFHSPREAPAQLPQFVPGEPAIVVKNTFIDLRAPEPPNSLLRSATTPSSSGKRDIVEEDIPAPPPPQLPLESFHTGDRFEDPIDEPEAPVQLPQLVPGEPAIIVKNTFIDLRAPEPPNSLLRSATTPSNRGKRNNAEEDIPAPPPPPQLPLEFFSNR